VAAAAKKLGVSKMTIYRMINDNEFPAVRMRNSIRIPMQAVDDMIATAIAKGAVVDASGWADRA
jgi:excisionase family DNA binding protein